MIRKEHSLLERVVKEGKLEGEGVELANEFLNNPPRHSAMRGFGEVLISWDSRRKLFSLQRIEDLKQPKSRRPR
jgi:hypothetical protein